MNKVILMGRLTRDAELKTVGDGISMARFTVAVNRRFAKADSEQKADFINCTAWRKTGEFIAKYFKKGSMIAVTGELQTHTYLNDMGEKRYVTEVNVSETYFAGEKSGIQTGTQTETEQQPSYTPSQGRPEQTTVKQYTQQLPGLDEDIPGYWEELTGSGDDLPF